MTGGEASEPTDYQIDAAMEVARLIDDAGNSVADARDAYQHTLTLGEHTAGSLRAGEALLLRLGLLYEENGRLYPSSKLAVLARVDDAESAEVIRARHRSVLAQELRELIGNAGEEAVLTACRENLVALGRRDLAARVQQVSLIDDTLGYDVHAPSVTGTARLLEVKSSGRIVPGAFAFYLSRNEYDTGRRNPDSWALVACTWDGAAAQVVGWCRAIALTAYLPVDGSGRWTEAFVHLPQTLLSRGLPTAV